MHQKVLSMILVLVMLLGLLSVSAFTTANTTSSGSADTSYEYNIMFLDCGRKYYSVDSIEKIIDNASAAGFNYIQLAVGNDGLRFLLNDMSLTVGDQTYESNAVEAAIHKGNTDYNATFQNNVSKDTGKAYPYSPTTNELTQSEMDEIIAYAQAKGMGVIPCVNTPGHMDAILSAANSLTGTNCSYNGSVRTIDVTNDTAVAFTQALLQKYITYFANKGCKLFNMGADEYANDIYTGGSMGFGNLQESGNYRHYVNYVNDVAAMIKHAGMKPMAFNDGIYFNGNISSGTFDTDIIVCYWSSGWSGYSPMSASDLASKGFRLVNTNGSYYWVLGKNAKCSAETASNFNTTAFYGSTVSNPAGSMFCIWADYPGAESEADVISKTADTIAAFGNTLPAVNKVETVEPETVTQGDVAVTAPGLTRLTVTEATAPTIDTAAEGKVSAYDVTPATDKGPYAGSGSVSLPVPDDWDASRVRGYIVNGDSSVTTGLTGTTAKGKFTFTVPHFSKMGIYELAANAADKTENITVMVGKENTITVDGRNDAGTYTTEDPSIATVKVTGTNAVAESVNYPQADSITTYDQLISSNSTEWKETGYYYKAADGNYYPLLAKRSSSWSWSWFQYTYTYTWGYRDNSGNIQSAGSYQTTNPEDSLSFNVYNKATVPASPAKTTIVFKGLKAGTTKVTIGDTQYIIKVTDEDLSTVTPLTIEYWITNGRVKSDANSSTTAASVSATDDGIATETGKNVSGLVPSKGIKVEGGREVDYWRCRMLDTTLANSSTSTTEKQTEQGGDDETVSGIGFTKIRYYGGNWQVFTENNAWVTVDTVNNQLVAYYLENIKVSDEVDSFAADWGNRGDGSPGGWLDTSNYCTLSMQVVYEDGTTNPTGTAAKDLESKTIVYGYWSNKNGRGIGTVLLEGQEYEIYKVTSETGAATASFSGYNATVTNFTWDKNETTVWQGEPSSSVSIHNDATGFSSEGVNANLCWDENKEAILLRVYVRAKVTEDSLTVNYFDENNTSLPFYSYNIAVASGTTFNDGFAYSNGALINNTVENIKGVTQTVNWQLEKMPEIGAQYRFGNYTFTSATKEKETGSKVVNLYYRFNSEKTFVVDFGLPLHITKTDISPKLSQANIEGVTVGNSLYATVSANDDYSIDYILNKTIDGSDRITVTYTGTKASGESDSATYNLTIIPATSVYYEDSFASFTDGTGNAADATWKTDKDGTAAKATTTQALTELGKMSPNDVYGHDAAYADSTKLSMGSARKVTVKSDMYVKNDTTTTWPTATFTFKGTGFDVISLTSSTSGSVVYTVTGKNTHKTETHLVDTYYGYKLEDNKWVVDKSSNSTLYQIPVIKVTGLTYDEYTVTLSVRYGEFFDHQDKGNYSFWLDAIRVYDPMDKNNVTYTQDNEGYPQYIKLRDEISKDDSPVTANVLFIDGGPEANVDTYKNYGPNNEVYLAEDQAIAFNVPGGSNIASIQIGAKAPNGSAAKMVVNGGEPKDIQSATEMYYEIGTDGGNFTITNTGKGILSLTNLKITYTASGESVSLAPLTTADQANAVAQVRALFAAPAEPFQPDRFEASWGHAVRKGDAATLTVKASEDVDSITVDGQTITAYVTKTERTGWGWWAKTVTYREFTYQVAAEETTDYTICAVNSAGVSSDPITATLTVRPSVRDWWHGIFDKWF